VVKFYNDGVVQAVTFGYLIYLRVSRFYVFAYMHLSCRFSCRLFKLFVCIFNFLLPLVLNKDVQYKCFVELVVRRTQVLSRSGGRLER